MKPNFGGLFLRGPFHYEFKQSSMYHRTIDDCFHPFHIKTNLTKPSFCRFLFAQTANATNEKKLRCTIVLSKFFFIRSVSKITPPKSRFCRFLFAQIATLQKKSEFNVPFDGLNSDFFRSVSKITLPKFIFSLYILKSYGLRRKIQDLHQSTDVRDPRLY